MKRKRRMDVSKDSGGRECSAGFGSARAGSSPSGAARSGGAAGASVAA